MENRICVERDNIIKSGFLNSLESHKFETGLIITVLSGAWFIAIPLLGIDYMNAFEKIVNFIIG